MISYKDFAPKQVNRSGFLRQAEYETFDEAVEAAGAWIEQGAVTVINVETVVLPNIWGQFEEGTEDVALATAEGYAVWHQFVRVWYKSR